MSLTTHQITLVETTFAQVAPHAAAVSKIFYARLFEIAPHVRPLFTHSMDEQGAKLMQMIAIAVSNLHKLESIIPAVQKLGERHVHYGVKAEDYDTVGAALLWTLEQGLGEAFTPEVKEAWTLTYGALASIAIGDHYKEAAAV